MNIARTLPIARRLPLSAVPVMAALLLAGCTNTQTRLAGAGAGAAAGAVVAGPIGAGVGGVVGALSGPTIARSTR